MTLELEELEKATDYLERMAASAREIMPALELLREIGYKPILPLPTDRLIQRGDISKFLKVGGAIINQLIREKKLTPLYVGDSTVQKFRLSEVKQVVSTECPKPKTGGFKKGK